MNLQTDREQAGVTGWRDIGEVRADSRRAYGGGRLAWSRWYLVDKQREAVFYKPSFATQSEAYKARGQMQDKLGCILHIEKGQTIGNRQKHYHIYVEENDQTTLDKMDRRKADLEAWEKAIE